MCLCIYSCEKKKHLTYRNNWPLQGTSDGRFLAAAGCSQVIELGLSHATIHKVDEHVSIHDLQVLTDIYFNLLKRLLLPFGGDENPTM